MVAHAVISTGDAEGGDQELEVSLRNSRPQNKPYLHKQKRLGQPHRHPQHTASVSLTQEREAQQSGGKADPPGSQCFCSKELICNQRLKEKD